jgi:Zn-dependent M28 family amino/carboxypeptidase
MKSIHSTLICAASLGLTAVSMSPLQALERIADLQPALSSITSDDLLRHIRVLSSDEFEGRAPASKGEELTVNYLTEQFKRLGLKPGNPDGTFIQKVPMAGMKATSTASFVIGGQTVDLQFPQDYVGWAPRGEPATDVKNSDLIFVGYGVVAPEYNWDDYKGVDVKGKTLVMLVNDPAVPDPNDPAKLDDSMFKGRAMTYYGRWTYKFEIAAAKGAAAAMVIHETGPAGYPYFVVINSWSRENFDLKSRTTTPVQIASWMSLERAKSLLTACGQDFDKLKQAAVRRDFKPVPLGAKVNFSVRNQIREVESRNVIAKLEGSDPKLKNEYVIYTAHWDHLGRDPKLEGDQIFNGALDNASGTACLLELAEAFTRVTPPPQRSILFLAVTAEEQGLLGAKYYATHPLYPLENTLANLNMDGFNQWGRAKDLAIIGYGNSTLDDLVFDIAKGQGRVVRREPSPEKGYFYRSDHFEFAKEGVPALYLDELADEYIGKPPGYGAQKRAEYTDKDYHKVSDEIKPDWDLAGAVEDMQLQFQVGYRVAQGRTWPEWKPGTEFKQRREEMLRKAGKK